MLSFTDNQLDMSSYYDLIENNDIGNIMFSVTYTNILLDIVDPCEDIELFGNRENAEIYLYIYIRTYEGAYGSMGIDVSAQCSSDIPDCLKTVLVDGESIKVESGSF